MIRPIPAPNEASFLGFALVDALIDLLVEKGVISGGEVVSLLGSLSEECLQDERTLSQRSAEILTVAVMNSKIVK